MKNVSRFPQFLRLDDREGPAPPLAEARRKEMIERALGGGLPLRKVAPRATRSSHLRAGLGLALLAASGLAAAGIGLFKGTLLHSLAITQERTSPGAESAMASKGKSPQAPEVPAREESAREREGPAGEVPAREGPGGSSSMEVVVPPTRGTSTVPVRTGAGARMVEATALPRTSSHDLLHEANELRGQKQWQAAEQRYEQVVGVAPESVDAYSAEVAAAALRLEHLNDPAGASRMYANTLRRFPGGALSEEIRWGMAQSAAARGADDEERSRLAEFVSLYPQSLRRGRAIERLALLRAAPVASGISGISSKETAAAHEIPDAGPLR